jgi:hypothetical protein
MKKIIRLVAVLLLTTSTAWCAEPASKQFLRYVYGVDGIDITNICQPSDDLWMLSGAKNTNALAAIDNLNISSKSNGIISGVLGPDLYFIEMRNGKVDPAFSLVGAYAVHHQMISAFLVSVLSRNQTLLARVVTDTNKVEIVGPKAGPGDMEQYASIVEIMPIIRSSKPADDVKSQSVTYRVPVGDVALSLTLVKEAGLWKIETSHTVRVNLEYFFR